MSFFSQLFSHPLIAIASLFAILIALTVHEFSHALAGFLLGDNTAKHLGRLSLNPLAHLDPVGFILMLTAGFGWAKPVPYNPYNLKWPKWGPVVVGLAGPASNFFLAILSFSLTVLCIPLLGYSNLFIVFLISCFTINLMLCFFNLIPLPPLDGSSVLLALLAHPRYVNARYFIMQTGPKMLLAIIFIDMFTNANIIGSILRLPIELFLQAAHFFVKITPIYL